MPRECEHTFSVSSNPWRSLRPLSETQLAVDASLREILAEALEFNRSEARQAAENDYTEELVIL